jgi:tetratricopeptide (TPR) repeat protein
MIDYVITNGRILDGDGTGREPFPGAVRVANVEILQDRGALAEAIQCYRRAIRLEPRNARLWQELARLRLDRLPHVGHLDVAHPDLFAIHHVEAFVQVLLADLLAHGIRHGTAEPRISFAGTAAVL